MIGVKRLLESRYVQIFAIHVIDTMFYVVKILSQTLKWISYLIFKKFVEVAPVPIQVASGKVSC